MQRFVQICASSNDLFGLDEEGEVHRYDFSTKAWVKLTHARPEGEAAERVDGAVRTGSRDTALRRR